MHTIGIDPDVRNLSIARWGPHGPEAAIVVHVTGSGDEPSQVSMARALEHFGAMLNTTFVSFVAIEGQQVDARRARSRDLFTLAHVTGAAIAWAARYMPSDARILVPTPHEWKASVAKHAMQARLYVELGWGYEIIGRGASSYARPVNPPSSFSHITAGQWKHVGDALLLAKWAYRSNQ